MRSHPIVSVIAGGYSFKDVPQIAVPGHRIAVNDSAYHLDWVPSEIVSMDRQWTEHRIERLTSQPTTAYLRRSAVQNLIVSDISWIHIFDCDNETWVMDEGSEIKGALYRLNGTNSGMCALNRAYKIATNFVFLFGFDMRFGPKGEKHWYGDYDWPYQPNSNKLERWAMQHRTIAKQFARKGIKVYNVSNRSLIDAFPMVWCADAREEAWKEMFHDRCQPNSGVLRQPTDA